MADNNYARLMKLAAAAGKRLNTRQRAAAVAACGERVREAVGEYRPLEGEINPAIETAWLIAVGVTISRDERKARAFALHEKFDAATDLTTVEKQTFFIAMACFDALEEGSDGVRGLSNAVQALSDALDSLVDEPMYQDDEAFGVECAWFEQLVDKCEHAPSDSLTRALLSWPNGEAPIWLVRGWNNLEEDDGNPEDLAEQQKSLPALFAERAAARARAFAESRRGKTFAPWREPTGLPEGITQIKIGKGLSTSEGKIVTSGFDRSALLDKDTDALIFVPTSSVAIGMSPDESEAFSWRVERESGSGNRRGDCAWTLERYNWAKRKLIDRHRITSQAIDRCSPGILHVPAEYDGKVVVLKSRNEDSAEQKIYVVYGKNGVLGETLRAADIKALIESDVENSPTKAPARAAMSAAEAQATFTLLDANFPQDGYDFSVRPVGERWLPEALALLDQPKGRLKDSVPLALFITRVARFIQAKADFKSAEALAQRSVDMSEKLVAKDDAALLQPLLALGNILGARGRGRNAEPVLRRALSIAEAAHGKDSAEVATALNDLGNVLYANDKAEECVEAFKRARDIREAVLPSNHPDTATSLSDLGTVISDDEPAEGEALLRKALAIREAAYGDGHPDVAITLDNLASLLDEQERLDEALELAERAVAIFEKCHGPHHPDVAIALRNMAVRLHDKMGRYADAEIYYLRALAADEAASGLQSVAMADAYYSLGVAQRKQGKLEEAQTSLRCALAIHDLEYDNPEFELVDDLNQLGGTLQDLRKLDEAQPMFERALEIVEELCEEPHRRIGLACHNLAYLLNERGSCEEAKEVYRRALENYEATSQKTSIKIANTLRGLAEVLLATKELQEAESLMRRSLQIEEEVYGESHAELSGPCIWLGRILHAQGRFDEAEALFLRALAIDETEARPNEVRITLSWIGSLYQEMERWQDAIPIYERMLSIAELKGPVNHQVAIAADHLARSHVETGNHEAAVPLLERSLVVYESKPSFYAGKLLNAHFRLANLLVYLACPLEAKPHFDRASELAEDDDEEEDD